MNYSSCRCFNRAAAWSGSIWKLRVLNDFSKIASSHVIVRKLHAIKCNSLAVKQPPPSKERSPWEKTKKETDGNWANGLHRGGNTYPREWHGHNELPNIQQRYTKITEHLSQTRLQEKVQEPCCHGITDSLNRISAFPKNKVMNAYEANTTSKNKTLKFAKMTRSL